mmetsp:Transcript_34755/g.100686  ORF Transcript_34755/g.100686 Transcript_34755/m.100686 type:complete len:232 (-) Transcript_34755:674-1369(-)
MRGVVSEPHEAAPAWPRLAHEGPRRAVHGQRALPLAHHGQARGQPTVRGAEWPSSHAHGQIVGGSFVVVAVSMLHQGGGDGPPRRGHGAGVGIVGVGNIAAVGVQALAFRGAEEVEDAPHAPAAVKGEDAVDVRRRRVLWWSPAVGVEKIENVLLGRELGAPPAHLLGQLRDSRAVQEVLRVSQVQPPNGEGVRHGGDMIGGHTLRRPDRACVVLPCKDVEIPQLVGVGDR